MAGNGHPNESQVGEAGNQICKNLENLNRKLQAEEAKEHPDQGKILHYQSQIKSCKKGLERKIGSQSEI